MTMTRQQMFNTAYHGLAAQGFTQSMRPDGEGCAYRGQDGKRCALGYLIPDNVYNPEWDGPDGTSAYFLAEYDTTNVICRANQQFLVQLQTVHDCAPSPDVMKERLADFAKEHGLTIPALPEFNAETAEREVVAAV